VDDQRVDLRSDVAPAERGAVRAVKADTEAPRLQAEFFAGSASPTTGAGLR
jgi:hypothetical protein